MIDKVTNFDEAHQLMEKCRLGMGYVAQIAQQSQQEAHHLYQQTGFGHAPTVHSANYILSKMKKWYNLYYSHRRVADDMFEKNGVSDYIDYVNYCLLTLDDFISSVQSTKNQLISAPRVATQPQPQQTGSVSPQHGGGSPQNAMQSSAVQAANKLNLDRLRAASEHSTNLMKQVNEERWKQMAQHSQAVRSLL